MFQSKEVINMLFKTTEAHEEFRAKIRKFAEEEVKPNCIHARSEK